jgi:hypothetical protein
MDRPDWDAEQRRLLAELARIDMRPDLWSRLEPLVRRWIDEQREADRRWQLHSKPRRDA